MAQYQSYITSSALKSIHPNQDVFPFTSSFFSSSLLSGSVAVGVGFGTSSNFRGEVLNRVIPSFFTSPTSPSTDRIRIIEQETTGNVLSPYLRTEKTNPIDLKSDTNQLNIVFSQTNQINKDILGQIGPYFTLDEYAGSVALQYEPNYIFLDDLRTHYLSKYRGKTNINAFIRLVENFDSSILETTEKVIPGRTNATIGTSIESHILDRSKVQRFEPTFTNNTYEDGGLDARAQFAEFAISGDVFSGGKIAGTLYTSAEADKIYDGKNTSLNFININNQNLNLFAPSDTGYVDVEGNRANYDPGLTLSVISTYERSPTNPNDPNVTSTTPTSTLVYVFDSLIPYRISTVNLSPVSNQLRLYYVSSSIDSIILTNIPIKIENLSLPVVSLNNDSQSSEQTQYTSSLLLNNDSMIVASGSVSVNNATISPSPNSTSNITGSISVFLYRDSELVKSTTLPFTYASSSGGITINGGGNYNLSYLESDKSPHNYSIKTQTNIINVVNQTQGSNIVMGTIHNPAFLTGIIENPINLERTANKISARAFPSKAGQYSNIKVLLTSSLFNIPEGAEITISGSFFQPNMGGFGLGEIPGLGTPVVIDDGNSITGWVTSSNQSERPYISLSTSSDFPFPSSSNSYINYNVSQFAYYGGFPLFKTYSIPSSGDHRVSFFVVSPRNQTGNLLVEVRQNNQTRGSITIPFLDIFYQIGIQRNIEFTSISSSFQLRFSHFGTDATVNYRIDTISTASYGTGYLAPSFKLRMLTGSYQNGTGSFIGTELLSTGEIKAPTSAPFTQGINVSSRITSSFTNAFLEIEFYTSKSLSDDTIINIYNNNPISINNLLIDTGTTEEQYAFRIKKLINIDPENVEGSEVIASEDIYFTDYMDNEVIPNFNFSITNFGDTPNKLKPSYNVFTSSFGQNKGLVERGNLKGKNYIPINLTFGDLETDDLPTYYNFDEKGIIFPTNISTNFESAKQTIINFVKNDVENLR